MTYPHTYCCATPERFIGASISELTADARIDGIAIYD